MLQYIIKRILIFIPTLIFISLITFFISLNAPGDPVEQMLNVKNEHGQILEKSTTEQAYLKLSKELGLDKPIFYFSFTNLTDCDTLYRIFPKKHRETLKRLTSLHGNWENISKYYHSCRILESKIHYAEKDSTNSVQLLQAKDCVFSLYDTYDDRKIKKIINNMENIVDSNSSMRSLKSSVLSLSANYQQILEDAAPYKKYIPVLRFYGLDNQYHTWITRFICGDFGISFQDKRPVSSVIWDAIGWTVLISILSTLIAYFVAIPIGVVSAAKKGSKADRVITTTLFMLYSLPSFWVATMLIVFLGGGDYLDWFPSFGLGTLPKDAPVLDRLGETAYHLILPLICWTYGSFAFLSRQMRGGILNVIELDYIRTARAKGLSESQVIWKHSFRNSLLPIITLFANIFPILIGGSFILEPIFSIPGMGKIAFDAINARNYPIIFTVMMFSSLLTMIGYLVADILYAIVDPRINFQKNN